MRFRGNSILLGILRIARGRADGIALFRLKSPGVSVEPGAVDRISAGRRGVGAFTEGPRRALTGLAMTLCALLTPAVVSYELGPYLETGGCMGSVRYRVQLVRVDLAGSGVPDHGAAERGDQRWE